MKQTIMVFCFFFLSFFAIEAGERIVDTLNQVDLIVVDRVNVDGYSFGEEYFACNRNDFPVYISIRLIKAENVGSDLAIGPMTATPKTKINLGSVLQTNTSKVASWRYEWLITTVRPESFKQ